MATQSRMNRPRGSGLDQFYGQQNAPTSFQRLQMNTGARKAWGEEMRSNAPELLPPSERGAQESGRGYYSEERMKERERRIRGKEQAALLSPFVSGADLVGGNQARRLAQDSVMGAMQAPPPPQFPQIVKFY
jgi:hypothetical protein